MGKMECRCGETIYTNGANEFSVWRDDAVDPGLGGREMADRAAFGALVCNWCGRVYLFRFGEQEWFRCLSEDDGPDFAAGVRFACGWLVAVLLRLGDDRIRGIPYCRAMHDAAQLAAFGAGEPPAELPRSSVGLDALLDWLSRPLP